MTSTVARFEIGYSRSIDPTGMLVGPMPESLGAPAKLIALYRALIRTRALDAKAVALQRTGRLGTYASSLGQEAVSVGAASAMRAEDVAVPSFREHGLLLWRGVTLLEFLLFWGGDERGNVFAVPREDFAISVPVGSHAPHAIGAALAFKLRKEPRVTVCFFGDGGTSKGDVYEAFNIAGAWLLPVVFIISNNQWAISVPRRAQSAAETLAQKAIAAGFPGTQVDGNDVVAMHGAAEAAIERARRGEGPTLIEAVTYRLSDHTTADDASRYRDDAEVARHWQEEPTLRLRNYLTAAKLWSKEEEEALLHELAAEIEAAADAYLKTPAQDPATIFDYTYARLPADLLAQRTAALAPLDATSPVGAG